MTLTVTFKVLQWPGGVFNSFWGLGVDECVLRGLGLERSMRICHVGRVLGGFQGEGMVFATEQRDSPSGRWRGLCWVLFYLLSIFLFFETEPVIKSSPIREPCSPGSKWSKDCISGADGDRCFVTWRDSTWNRSATGNRDKRGDKRRVRIRHTPESC